MPKKDVQDTYDLYGKYTEVGEGDGCLIFSHRHKKDDSRDICVWRKTNPMSGIKSCHFFTGVWKDGWFNSFNIMERQSNEYKLQEKMLKELVMGTEEGKNYLTLVVAEYKLLDYDAMQAMNLSPGEWDQSAPDDKSIMQLYSKFKFMKDGTVHFQLRGPDNTVIESISFLREDRTNRQNLGTIKSIETNLLFAMYNEGRETAMALHDGNDHMLTAAALEVESHDEAFNDGDDVHLAAAGIQAEIQNDLGIGAPDVNFEVISSSDEDFNDGDDVHLAAAGIQAEIQNDLGIGAPDVNFEVISSSDEAFNDGDDVHLAGIQNASGFNFEVGRSGADGSMDENVVAESK